MGNLSQYAVVIRFFFGGNGGKTRTRKGIKGRPVQKPGVGEILMSDQALPLQPRTWMSLCSTMALMASLPGLRYWRGSK